MAKSQTKLPYMKWFPQDLEAEPTLKLCSWEAGFLWVKLIGLMHQSPERGYLLKQNGQPFTEADLVQVIAGATPERIRNCLFEIETQGVSSRDRRGVLYSRKMVAGEKRAANTKKKDKSGKSKNGDKTEIKETYFEDKSDLEPLTTHGDIKENSGSGVRSVVIPESRVQSPDIREERKNKKNTKKSSIPRPDEIPEILWADFLQIRKAKSLPLTQTALDGILREADKIGWSLLQTLTHCCESGWAGFKADWIENQNAKGKQHGPPTSNRPSRADINEATRRQVLESLDREQQGEET